MRGNKRKKVIRFLVNAVAVMAVAAIMGWMFVWLMAYLIACGVEAGIGIVPH